MISVNTRGDRTCSILADASRGIVCRVTVHALCTAMVILVDTGIVPKALIAVAGIDNAFTVLAKFIARTLFVTTATVRRVAFELIFGETHRFCVRATIGHAVMTCVGALSLLAATCPGCILVRTGGIASPTVIGIVAMNVDADILAIFYAKGFSRIFA